MSLRRYWRCFWNFVEGVGDGANEVFNASASGGGNGVELQIVFFAEGAKFIDARLVGRGVEFRRDDDHGFFGEGFAEGAEFAGDDFERFDWVSVCSIAAVNEVDNE